MSAFVLYLKSSIGKKQIVAATGLLLTVFVIGHLAGNLLLFLGPGAFNGYAEKLSGLRPGLYAVEAGLAVIFFVHIWLTAVIVIENRLARPVAYRVSGPAAGRSPAARLMPYTGAVLLIFLIQHLRDFTLTDHSGPLSVLADGRGYGLYGVVYNAFLDPVHSAFYVIAMLSLGLHLSHGLESFIQTFGFSRPAHAPAIRTLSHVLGGTVAVLYGSIPVYILLQSAG